MSIIIESGVGDGNRLAVFDDRLRELEVQQSATNHISTSILGGRTGVFTVSGYQSPVAIANNQSMTAFSIINNDPNNLLVVNQVYAIVTNSSVSLPDSGLVLALGKTSFPASVRPVNNNRFSTIKPIIVTNGGAFNGGIPIQNFNIIRVFPTLGDINELIIPGSDAIILQGQPSPSGFGSSNVTANHIIALSMFRTGSSITIDLYGYIKFMMIPPGELG